MENKIVNKQISINKIIEVANYLEEYRKKYSDIFAKEEEKNKDLPFNEKKYEYENGNAKIDYTIEFHNGQTKTESNYDWFIENIKDKKNIKEIKFDLHIWFYTREDGSDYNNTSNSIAIYVALRDSYDESVGSKVSINVDTKNQENESNEIYNSLLNIFNSAPERYNNTIKFRMIIIQSFTISVGIILSYIVYLLFKINVIKLHEALIPYMSNKYVLIFGQWIIALSLGNLFSYWYMVKLYKPLLPKRKYVGYSKSNYKSIYVDDIVDYKEYSEVHFGRYYDAEIRRNKIDKIFKITSRIVLLQLIISIIMYFILK